MILFLTNKIAKKMYTLSTYLYFGVDMNCIVHKHVHYGFLIPCIINNGSVVQCRDKWLTSTILQIF